ncbi:fibrinogen-like protein 1-like protein [Podargus strigoides]
MNMDPPLRTKVSAIVFLALGVACANGNSLKTEPQSSKTLDYAGDRDLVCQKTSYLNGSKEGSIRSHLLRSHIAVPPILTLLDGHTLQNNFLVEPKAFHRFVASEFAQSTQACIQSMPNTITAAQCLLLLVCVLILAAPGHFTHIQTLNIFKKSPSNTSASALRKTSWSKDCSEVSAGSPSGIYVIQPTGLHPIVVYCEMNGTDGAWTVIQRNRQSTEITWAESWSTYKYGFGNVHTEYWLGTEYIHQISKQKVYQVRFVIWDSANTTKFADYNLFHVEDESHGYRLRLGTYSGTAEDAMDSDNPRNMHNNMKFSAKDLDQDTSSGNCASSYGGGWWYSACYSVRLNVKGAITWGSLCNGNCKASAILIKPAPYH